jgi:hypothetical protein
MKRDDPPFGGPCVAKIGAPDSERVMTKSNIAKNLSGIPPLPVLSQAAS